MIPSHPASQLLALLGTLALVLCTKHEDSSDRALDFKSFTYDIGSWLGKQAIDPAHEEGAVSLHIRPGHDSSLLTKVKGSWESQSTPWC